LRARAESTADQAEAARLELGIATLAEREKRLVRLFTFGEIDETVVREEGAALRRERAGLESRLSALRAASLPAFGHVDAHVLRRACAAVGD
jgi:hypothetical protein